MHCFSLFSLYFQFWRLFQKSLCTLLWQITNLDSLGPCPSQIAMFFSLGVKFIMKWKPTYIYGDMNFSDSQQVFANLFSWQKIKGSLIISWKFQGRTPQEIWITAIFPARSKVVSYDLLHHSCSTDRERSRFVLESQQLAFLCVLPCISDVGKAFSPRFSQLDAQWIELCIDVFIVVIGRMVAEILPFQSETIAKVGVYQ